MNVKKRAAGTLDEPNLIPSLYDKRLVGCVCKFQERIFFFSNPKQSLNQLFGLKQKHLCQFFRNIELYVSRAFKRLFDYDG